MAAPRVVVVGGTGFYGRYLVRDVLDHTDAEVTVVSRRPPSRGFGDPRVSHVAVDIADGAALVRAVAGAAVVANCAGPFQALAGRPQPLGPLHAALEAGVPYVDIGEDGSFRAAALRAATDARAPVLPGVSVVPALQEIALADLARGLDRVTEIRCAAAPDTRRHRGDAMFRAMLHGLGSRFQAPRDGRLQWTHGWSEPEWATFPEPIGRRLVYQVYEMADLEVLSDLYGADTISFKAGSEYAGLNRLLGVAALLRARTGRPRRPERLTTVVRASSWLVGRFGDDSGGFLVEVTGQQAGCPVRRGFAMTAAADGGRIPSLLAGIAVQEVLNGRLTAPGYGPPQVWLTPQQAWQALAARGVALWRRDEDESWRRLVPEAATAP